MDISDNSDKKYEDTLRPIHYKFRFTFTEQDKEHNYESSLPRFKNMARRVANKFTEHYTITKMTGGVETLNKNGDRTYAHMHLHFDAIENRNTMARLIKRYLTETYDQDTTGIKAFSFKPDVVRNLDDFYRYPLKQNLDKQLCYGYSEDELSVMHEIAKSSFEKVVEVNQSKLDKSDNSDTLFQRLIIFLDKTNATLKIPLLIEATKFYVQENKPINKRTIEGYVDSYMLQKEYTSYEEYWG